MEKKELNEEQKAYYEYLLGIGKSHSVCKARMSHTRPLFTYLAKNALAVQDLTTSDEARAFKQWFCTQASTKGTYPGKSDISHCISRTRVFYSYLVKTGKVKHNPFLTIKEPLGRVRQVKPHRQQALIDRYTGYLESRNFKVRGIEGKVASARQFLTYCYHYHHDFGCFSISQAEGFREHLRMVTKNDGSLRYHPASINGRLADLRVLYTFLVSVGIATLNPFKDTWRVKTPKQLPKTILTVEQMGQLLSSVSVKTELKLKAVLELLYATGMRISEVENLRREDIYLDHGYVQILDDKQRQDRKVPLTEYATGVLRLYLKENRTEYPFLQGTKRTFNRWVNDQLKKKAHLLELPVITCHCFRHSIATHLLKAGAGIRQVQSFLGHRRLRNTETYIRVLTEDLKDVVEQNHPREVMA